MPTPHHKRKSSGNQIETPQSVKKIKQENASPKKTPKLARTPKTPAKNLNVSQNTNSAGKKQQGSPKIKSPKTPKLEMFTGTTKLDLSKNESVKKEKKQKNVKKEPSNVKVQTGEKSEGQANRHQRRREKLKHRRTETREKFKQLASRVGKGDVEARREVEEKIEEIESMTKKSKNCARKLRMYKRMLTTPGNDQQTGTKSEKKQQQNKQPAKNQQKQVIKAKQQEKKEEKSQKLPQLYADDSESEEEDEASDEGQVASKQIEEGSDAEKEESGDEEKAEAEEDESDEEDDDESGEEDDDESGEEEDVESSEEEEEEAASDDEHAADSDEKSSEEETNQQNKKNVAVKNQKKEQQKQKMGVDSNETAKGKPSRYVVFVGNLPYTATKEEIMEHFKKVGDIVDIRVPTDKDSKKPKGFAYVELKNEPAYQVIEY